MIPIPQECKTCRTTLGHGGCKDCRKVATRVRENRRALNKAILDKGSVFDLDAFKKAQADFAAGNVEGPFAPLRRK